MRPKFRRHIKRQKVEIRVKRKSLKRIDIECCELHRWKEEIKMHRIMHEKKILTTFIRVYMKLLENQYASHDRDINLLTFRSVLEPPKKDL